MTHRRVDRVRRKPAGVVSAPGATGIASLLQALFTVAPPPACSLPKKRATGHRSVPPATQKLCKALAKAAKAVADGGPAVPQHVVTTILTCLTSQSVFPDAVGVGDLNDPHEFLLALLRMYDDASYPLVKPLEFVVTGARGPAEAKQRVYTLSCSFTGEHKACVNVADAVHAALKNYSCGAGSTRTGRWELAVAPEVIFVHAKDVLRIAELWPLRLVGSAAGQHASKIKMFVKLAPTLLLDLATPAELSASYRSICAGDAAAPLATPELVTEFLASRMTGFKDAGRYKLCAAVVHHGLSPAAGRFTAYVQPLETDEAYHCDGESVTPVLGGLQTVVERLSKTGAPLCGDDTPFLLVYRLCTQDVRGDEGE